MLLLVLSVEKKLGIQGEDANGVITGVDFLREVNLGNKINLKGNVVVIGGGNVAIDVARAAIRENAENVEMYCLESREEMPALGEEIDEALEEKIAINNSWGPSKIIVENGKVSGVEFKKCISVLDSTGKFSPKFDDNDVITVKADYVLLSVGQSIDWSNLLDDSNVGLNKNNTAIADSLTYQTSEPDIFVGGDVYTGPSFAIDAIAAGKQGAISIHRFVWEGQSLTLGRDRRQYHSFDKEDIIVEGFDTTSRQRPSHLKAKTKSYTDNRVTFTEEQMKKETERCLGCGAVVIDTEMCIGCGQCTLRCEFDAIGLVKKYDEVGTTFEKLPIKLAVHNIKRAGNITARSVKNIFANK